MSNLVIQQDAAADLELKLTQALDAVKTARGQKADRVQELCDLVGITKRDLAAGVVLTSKGDNSIVVRSFQAADVGQEKLPDYIFRRKGSAWQIRFNGGKDFILLPTKGAEYLCILLGRAGTEIPVIDIVSGATVNSCTHLIDIHNAEEEGVRISRNHPMFSAIGKVSDKKTLNECHLELARLQVELEQARADNNNVEIEHCTEQMTKIISYINKATGAGKLRDVKDKRKSLSDALRKSVNSVIKKIAETDKSFADHLTGSLKFGFNPCYRPHTLMSWETRAISNN